MSKKKAIKNKKPHRLALASAIDVKGKEEVVKKKNEARKLRKAKKAESRRVKAELKKKGHALI